jgi:hypothetical protein
MRRHIGAVFVPSWFWEPGGARHPLADRSPVAKWVGAPRLRALRVYLPDEWATYPSVLYTVGSSPSLRRRINSLVGSPAFSVEGPLSTRRKIVRRGFEVTGPLGGPLHWRIAAPATEITGPLIRLSSTWVDTVRSAGVFEPRDPTLVNPAAFVDCTQVAAWARESVLDVAFPGSPVGFSYLDVGGARAISNVQATIRELPPSRNVLIRACGDPASVRGGIFPAGSTAVRIIGHGGRFRRQQITFDYLDSGRGRVSFNFYDEAENRWLYGVARLHRCGSGRWVRARLPIDVPAMARGIETVELGPVVNGRDLIMRNLRLVQGSRQIDCETAER